MLCGGYGTARSGIVSELRLLHGRSRFHAILLDNRGSKLFRTRHLNKTDCLVLLRRFTIRTAGSFVVFFLDYFDSKFLERRLYPRDPEDMTDDEDVIAITECVSLWRK
jgi:hypothetical protein